jgi:hypothetical protein
MKPRNFPTRKLRRKAAAKWTRGDSLTQSELMAMQQPRDIRIRIGRKARQ